MTHAIGNPYPVSTWRMLRGAIAVCALVFAPATVNAALAGSPDLFDSRERLAKPDPAALGRIRFVTTTTFPPFNFVDTQGRLSGYNVDLARAICDELAISGRCEIQAVLWEELQAEVLAGRADAEIAGIAATAESRKALEFGRAYFVFPARFIRLRNAEPVSDFDTGLRNRRVGVVAGTAHAAMLKDWFPESVAVEFADLEAVYAGLGAGAVALAFGDGLTFSFYLSSERSANCCAFAGEAYFSPQFLGSGLSIGFSPDSDDLRAATDYALRELYRKGVLEELYRRYFPIDFF